MMATLGPLGGTPLLPPQPLPAAQPPMASLHPQAQQQARLDAYRKVVRIFMQGAYDLAKEDALASLRNALAISEQEHMAVRQEAVAEVQHQLQLTQPASQPAEPSVGHSSQPPESSRGAAKRATPSSGSKAAAAAAAAAPPPRKRTRASEGGAAAPATAAAGAGGRGGGGAAAGPALPAPRAAAALGEIDPLVGHVVLRNWPNDGGWFKGVVSDFRPSDGAHCIIYDLGKPTESFEWYHIRGASPEDCVVKDERVDFADLGLPGVAPPAPAAAPAAASGGGGSKSRKAPAAGAGAAASGGAKQAAAKQASSAAKQQPAGAARQGAGASKAGASRQAAGASKPPAGASKAGSSRPAPSKPSPVTAAVQQAAAAVQQPQAAAAVAAPAAPAPAAQQPARNGKTHHARLQNGLTSHAAAVKQALAAGGRPPYLTGPSLLPRRTRSWSSDEDDSDDDDE